MAFRTHAGIALTVLITFAVAAPRVMAQNDTPVPAATVEASNWHFMQDAVLFGMYNNQGGPRGGSEFKVPNWWMGMLSRQVGSSQITFNTMFSLDPATLDKQGYREIFQVGETFEGEPLIDHQHPHDFFMQLAAVWRIPLGTRTGFTLAGAPSGEPALGPVAFMHRASAADNPLAPLSHHTFDSTHIGFGVVTAAVDHGRWIVEASAFNGREPDEHRWDFDFGRLDSASARLWFRPGATWEFQASAGRLKDPETLEPGDITRATASGAWFRNTGGDFSAVTAAYGVNLTEHGNRHAALVEATRFNRGTSLFMRAEVVHVETSLLLADTVASEDDDERKDPVGALTVGAMRDVLTWGGFQGGLGASVTGYTVPSALTGTHGFRPVSYQVFFRLRPPPSSMGRMWNMRMAQPMKPATDPHAGHVMN